MASADIRTPVSILILLTVLCGAPATAAEPETPSALAPARRALRNREFDKAVAELDKALAGKVEYLDEALYLRALALHYAEQYDEAIKSADAVTVEHKKSPWYRKARFLKASALSRLRRFKAAETIYEEEAKRLLSEARKEKVAGVIIGFADALTATPGPGDLDAPPPNYSKAYRLYGKALEMEIGRDLRDEVMFKRARTIQLAKSPGQAIRDYRAYLAEFDPTWAGPVGSPARLSGRTRENPKPTGEYPLEARYRLALAQLDAGQHPAARANLEDLRKMLSDIADARKERPEIERLRVDTAWQLVRAQRMPNPPANELDRAVKAARDFLAKYGDDPRAVVAAYWIPLAWHRHDRADQAINGYRAFLTAKNYELPKGEAATKDVPNFNSSPAELQDRWRKLSLYQIGLIRYGQKEYEKAREAWNRYVRQYPNGPHWASCQRGLINAEFQVAVDAVADKKYDRARKLFDAFLTKHPLDDRARQILFTLGQIDYAAAQKLEEEKADTEKIQAAYRRATDRWQRLVSKYPGQQESSLALYRIGIIYEEKLGDLDKALESYRRLTWGPYAQAARARVAVMTEKQLEVRTERKFRTNEPALVTLNVRNIETLKFEQYFLDLEAYFRKTHVVGRVDLLDIDLIQPDASWEVTIDEYAKYKPLEQQVEIPFDEGKPGVCIIHVSDDDLEAMTLVIRSDLDLIARTSRRETLVFVQDMVKKRPAEGVDLLLSDGEKVFATGETGADGVFRGAFNELKRIDTVRVFALRDGHAASNQMGLKGLGFSSGLTDRGYIYTDRPAYQPGQTVKVRGIIRNVKNGSYVVPEAHEYVVSVTDAGGRMLWQQPQELSDFGTFHTKMTLDERAPLGTYTITAQRKDRGRTYSSTFRVQRFKLEKMRLRMKTDRDVYFRGEKVELTLHAVYYWGQPVAAKSVRYHLPDGREYVEKTDKDGKLVVTFDTTGFTPGRPMTFSASIEGENVQNGHTVTLARQGFRISVMPSRDLVLAGEPFDVKIKTTAPDGEPVGRPVRLFVLRRQVPQPDPVLKGVPWIDVDRRPSTELTVQEKRVTTDKATGLAKVNLALEGGGEYILRATGEDRFEQIITAQGRVHISDEEDATKLRFFADSDTLQVGREARFRLHSRLDAPLALLTFEGERIISHRVIKLDEGYNPIELDVGHEHFPNFRVAVSVMDGRRLRTAAKPFEVERRLKVTVRPLEDVYPPGAESKVQLTVTDQLDRPVRAELSLALIDEALFAIYPDTTPRILDFFQRGAVRHAEFRAVTSCSFEYKAITRNVLKAYQDEKSRLARREREQKDLNEFAQRSLKLADEAAANGRRARRSAALERPAGKPRTIPAPPEPSQAAGERNILREKDGIKKGKARGWGARAGVADEGGQRGTKARREMPEAGRWFGSVVTDAKGKAVVTMPLPENTTEWRLTARGCTVETLVGEATANVVTRKDFFLSIKAPQLVREGDTIRVLTRVHNMTDYAGPVDLALDVFGGEELDRRLAGRQTQVKIEKQGAAEALFDAVDIPLAPELKVRVTATAGDHRDALETTLPVRPWGLEFADQAGGVSKNSRTVEVELPGKRKYASRWMMISVGPDLKRSVIEMALGGGRPLPVPVARSAMPPRRPQGGFTGSDLLAAVSALEYARAVKAPQTDHQRIADRARALVSALVASQGKDGGWCWTRANHSSDWAATAASFWALQEAKQQGISVHPGTLGKAKTYLNNMFTRLSANDNDAKAVILHALSTADAADFAHANRLHRVRNQLSAPALAYTALAFANLERDDFAGELLDVLGTKGRAGKIGEQTVVHWPKTSGPHPWLRDDVETTAVAALALMRMRPNAPQVGQAIAWLMDRRGPCGFVPAKAEGPAIRAVAAYYRSGKFADADYELNVLVNGKPVKTIESRGALPTVAFAVPRDLLAEGKNKIEFRMAGRGRYGYSVVLRGFSSDLKDPGSWHYPYVQSRSYRHAPLEYRGKPIGAGSTSPVKNIEIGQRVKVDVDIYGGSSRRSYLVVEESIPAGMMFVAGSLRGHFVHHEVHAGKLVMYNPPDRYVSDFSYELIGYATGTYRALPSVIRDTLHPGHMRVGRPATLRVLAPGERSDDPYRMNDHERYKLGRLYFDDGLYKQARAKLSPLFNRDPKHRYNERDVARMLLWIRTSEGFYDAKQIVELFEVLRERYPTLEIPFDKILVCGRAYRDIGEFERSSLVFRATIDASFVSDSNISAVLEDAGQFLGSIDYQEDLWREYPDTAQVTSAYFAISQALYQKAPRAHEMAEQARQLALARGEDPNEIEEMPSKVDMLEETIRILSEFLTLYPTNPLADDAAFSTANAFLDLKQYETVIELCEGYRERFADSEQYASGFQYMIALGHFWQRHHEQALEAAKVVAKGHSKDRVFARYIVGQIYHAEGKPADAIQWYSTVETEYADAKQAIDYFTRKNIALDEVNILRPGKPVKLTLTYRNIRQAFCQVYRVDLMKLYLREKNLSNITKVNLAGIEPLVEKTIKLGDGKDYVDKERTVTLELEDEGAYLVICRGDDLFASGLALITPLKIEIQEDAKSGRVRANVINAVEDRYVPEVHVKAIGSADREFRSGETDLRGIFVADGIRGKATVIARAGDARYAFYRGDKWLGAPKQQRPRPQPKARSDEKLDYQSNLRSQNQMMQRANFKKFDRFRRQPGKGVQMKNAW